MKKWVPEQIKPEISLEAKTTKMKLPHFGHIMRQGALAKTMMLGKSEGGRKGGRPITSQTDSLREAVGRAWWTTLLCRNTRRWSQFNSTQHRARVLGSESTGLGIPLTGCGTLGKTLNPSPSPETHHPRASHRGCGQE